MGIYILNSVHQVWFNGRAFCSAYIVVTNMSNNLCGYFYCTNFYFCRQTKGYCTTKRWHKARFWLLTDKAENSNLLEYYAMCLSKHSHVRSKTRCISGRKAIPKHPVLFKCLLLPMIPTVLTAQRLILFQFLLPAFI